MKEMLMKEMKKSNQTTTTNGAKAFKSSLDANVDLFGLGGSSRRMSDSDFTSLVSKALSEDLELGLMNILYLSDIREGSGERFFLKRALKVLRNEYPNVLLKLIKEIPELTRWDYLYFILEQDLLVKYKDQTPQYENRQGRATYSNFPKRQKGLIKDGYTFTMSKFSKEALEIIKKEYNKEIGENCTSLMYKWLKSINTSSILSKTLGSITRNYLGVTPKQYRKKLKKARKFLDVVERKMSKNKWNKIEYSKVPSKATVRYSKAFERHDLERYQEFLEKVNTGEEKINTSVTYPHDVIHQYALNSGGINSFFGRSTHTDATLETVWNNLPNFLEGTNENILPIIDTSGSMWQRVSDESQLQVIEVAVGMGIYFAERMGGEYKNHWINFSTYPSFQKLEGNTLRAKVSNLDYSNWEQSTNIDKVFKLILDTAVKNNVKQENLPTKLLIISDMQFNGHVRISNYKEAKKAFKEKGYEIPQVIFWQMNAYTPQTPVKYGEHGTALISGYSPNICKIIANGTITTPLETMHKTIYIEKYINIVKEILK